MVCALLATHILQDLHDILLSFHLPKIHQLILQQDTVTVDNSCVWLATCLVVRSVDESLANVLITEYHKDHAKYECFYMFNKGATDTRTLYNYLQWCTECYFTLKRVKPPGEFKHMSLTEYILDEKKEV